MVPILAQFLNIKKRKGSKTARMHFRQIIEYRKAVSEIFRLVDGINENFYNMFKLKVLVNIDLKMSVVFELSYRR